MSADLKAAQVREWRRRNPESVKRYNAACYAARKIKNPKYEKDKRLKKYDLTPESYDALFMAQDRACAICKRTDPGKRGWQIDHDHVTNKVRGILCVPCNLVLGHMKDSIDRLIAAAKYLETNNVHSAKDQIGGLPPSSDRSNLRDRIAARPEQRAG